MKSENLKIESLSLSNKEKSEIFTFVGRFQPSNKFLLNEVISHQFEITSHYYFHLTAYIVRWARYF